ncbi:MAG: DUF1640 domain-containing protein [Nitrospirae bacterium YQR-1]
MSESVIFDTHAYVKKLKAVGFTEEQAEVQTEVLSELLEKNLATKLDLKELESKLARDLKELESRLEVKIESSKSDIIKWVAAMLVAQASLMAVMFRLFRAS